GNLIPRHVSLYLSSLRVYGLSKEIAEQIGRGRKSGFTIAPEAGSQRLRDVINKNISEEDIFNAVTNTFEQGWEIIKLYTMIGLPTETDDDVEAIADMAIKIWKIGCKILGKKARINLAVSTFIPKPFTPFQWVPFISEEDLARKQKIIADKIIPFKKIKFNFNSYKISVLEALLSQGDRKVAEIVYTNWKNGARFDAWRDYFNFERWQNAVGESGIDINDYLKEKETNAPLCWEHIDIGVDKKFLIKEYEKSQKAAVTAPCEQPLLKNQADKTQAILDDKKYVCYNCGLDCDLESISKTQQQALNQWDEIEDALKKEIPEEKPAEEPVLFPLIPRFLFNFSKERPLHLLSHLDTMALI
ncbi:MAG: hypothetical protein KAR38_12985, partial [Calditrichia bacterium]|nr:hypothetical protein [Calditrichia bacterium]